MNADDRRKFDSALNTPPRHRAAAAGSEGAKTLMSVMKPMGVSRGG